MKITVRKLQIVCCVGKREKGNKLITYESTSLYTTLMVELM